MPAKTRTKRTRPLLDEIRDASIAEVEVDGHRWRVRRPTALSTLAAGRAVLPALVPPGGSESGPAPTPSAEAISEGAVAMDAIVCACVAEVGDADGWEPCRLVMLADDEQGDGVLWVERIPMSTRGALAGAILAAFGGGLADALARFRG